jgi:tellurite resistance protein TerC
MDDLWRWIFFTVFLGILLAIDLLVFNKKTHKISVREALLLSAFWIGLALLFNLWIYFTRGYHDALNFFTGYLIEKSLSVDNLFVFLLLFGYFKVPEAYLHKVLFWGVLGAIVFRAVFILFGVVLIARFHWIIYVFGIFLVYAGIRLITDNEKEVHPENNPILRTLRRWIPVTSDYHEANFFIKEAGKWVATPLFVVLTAVETTDIVFAIDSIPAILAITTDPFIVFTSNIFAILGLRSLYFALAGMMSLFHYLNYGLAAILVFVGCKMLISEIYVIPIGYALGFIIFSLAVAITCSLLFGKSDNTKNIQGPKQKP